MRPIHRKLLLGAVAIVAGLCATALRARAIESTNFVISPIPLSGSYGGGTSSSSSYRITLAWTGLGGRIHGSSRHACLGFLCASTGTSVFAPLTLSNYHP